MYEIKLGESEFKGLLNRAGVIADANRIFSAQLKVMVDITNYGTNLIPGAYSSSQEELKDVVLIGILLRQVVAMLDGIEVLASAGAIYDAELQSRALFEASVYMEWMLKDDTKKKADYYYVHNLRRIRRWGSECRKALLKPLLSRLSSLILLLFEILRQFTKLGKLWIR